MKHQCFQGIAALWRAVLILMAAATLTAVAQTSAVDDEIGRAVWALNSSAITAFSSGDPGTAERMLREALALDSTDDRTWYGFGRIHQVHSNHDSAVVCFRQCLKFGATSPIVFLSLAQSLLELNKYADAERVIAGIVHNEEPSLQACFLMTRIYAATGRDTLISDLLVRCEERTSDPGDFVRIASVYSEHGLHAQSARMYERAIEIDSSSTGLLYDVFKERSAAGDCSGTMKALDRCIAHFGADTGLHRAYLVAATECGDARSAAQHRAQVHDSDNTLGFDATYVRGLIMSGRYDEGLVRCYQALHADPSIPAAYALAMNALLLIDRKISACIEWSLVEAEDSLTGARISREIDWPADPRLACNEWMATLGGVDSTFAQPAPGFDYIHPESGVILPAATSNAVRTKIIRRSDPENGMSASYVIIDSAGKERGYLTAFIYEAGPSTRGPWFILNARGERFMDTTGLPGRLLQMTEPSMDFQREYWRARRDIVVMRHADPHGELRFIASERRNVIAPFAWYRYEDDGAPLYTAVYLFTIGSHFVKVRVTHAWNDPIGWFAPAEQLIRAMLAESAD